jgi:N-acetylglucosaminyldiphosphoundecaprenol N-acetyl-beta-D-mannosaminyltransferase
VINEASSSEKNAKDYHFLNAGSVYFSHKDPQVKLMYESSYCLLPDGKSFELAAKILSRKLSQVRGPWVFKEIIDKGREQNLRHFLLGTTNETLRLLEEKLKQEHPGVIIAGSYSPSFGTPSDEEINAQDYVIANAKPDIIWLGVSSPKQDFESQRLAHKFKTVTLAVGAAFDFVAGTQKEAPVFLQKIGGEWAYRLFSNPKRLWKRYLIGNFVFLYEAFRPKNNRST